MFRLISNSGPALLFGDGFVEVQDQPNHRCVSRESTQTKLKNRMEAKFVSIPVTTSERTTDDAPVWPGLDRAIRRT